MVTELLKLEIECNFHWTTYPRLSPFQKLSGSTIQRMRMDVSFIALTVTSLGGADGNACRVSNHGVASLALLRPAMFSAITRNLYLVNGWRSRTVSAVASGSLVV